MPAIFSTNGSSSRITKDERYLVNVGSVGQPRDRNTHLSFGILDTETWAYENIRTPYDIETAARKIIQFRLACKIGTKIIHGSVTDV